MAETNLRDDSTAFDAREPDGLRCDFCNEIVPRVRRIALDHDYERLQTRHEVRYACESCSDQKERERLEPAPSGTQSRSEAAG